MFIQSILSSRHKYCNERRSVFYVWKTWLNEDHPRTEVWVDDNVKISDSCF